MVTYPKDWRGCLLRELGIFTSGDGFPLQYQGDISGIYPFYKVSDFNNVGNERVMSFANNYISEIVAEKLHCHIIPSHSIIFAKIGAAIYLERKRLNVADCCVDNNMMAFTANENVDVHYLCYVFQKLNFGDFVRVTALPSLSPKIIGGIKIHLPQDIAEQKAIAATLSSFDTHIDNLTALIEKKKAIRDGALSDLMSGRTRLAGFSGEWETYHFCSYFSLIPNNTLARNKLTDQGSIGNVHYGDVLIKYGDVLSDKDRVPRIKEEYTINENNYLQENDVIIADTAEDETVGKVVQIGKISIPLVSGLHTVACRPNKETATGFLGYYMNSAHYHDQLYQYITGIKVSSISKKSLSATTFTIPSNLQEQKAIADILTSMDTEIQNLEAERDKMQAIQAGAMEDLLTGRVRLPM